MHIRTARKVFHIRIEVRITYEGKNEKKNDQE